MPAAAELGQVVDHFVRGLQNDATWALAAPDLSSRVLDFYKAVGAMWFAGPGGA